MKKILAIIFVAVMSSVILGGCSKDDDDIYRLYEADQSVGHRLV